MFTKQTIKGYNLSNKTVLLRADYNIPIIDGKVADDYRIRQSLPTIDYLLRHNVKLIICSHLGRPGGKVDPALSLLPVAKDLARLLDKKVEFVDDSTGPKVIQAAAGLKNGQILLLENLRFNPGEEANSAEFAKQLAGLAQVYVDDAFADSHRNHASLVAITKYLPSLSGLLLEKEVKTINEVMEAPKRPLTAIVGGAKVQDKLEIIRRFIKLADCLAIGGALANPFMVAKGIDVADSLLDKEEVAVAKQIMAEAEAEAKKRPFVLVIPHDSVVAGSIDKTAKTRIVDFSSNSFVDIIHYPKRVPVEETRLRSHEKIMDIGPFSAAFIAGVVQLSATVVWNGTMGVTEVPSLEGPIGPFAHGTETVIEAIIGDLGHKPFSLVGGGDTVGYVENRKLIEAFTHVSTGGGASLELMSGHKLPGVEALMDKK